MRPSKLSSELQKSLDFSAPLANEEKAKEGNFGVTHYLLDAVSLPGCQAGAAAWQLAEPPALNEVSGRILLAAAQWLSSLREEKSPLGVLPDNIPKLW